MKRNDIKDLQQKTVAQLHEQVVELVNKLNRSRVEKRARKLANTSLPSRLADDLARVKTILTQKTIEQAVQAAIAAQQKIADKDQASTAAAKA